MYVYIYMYVYVYMYVYTHTHTHTHMQTYTFLGHNYMKLEINYRKNNYSMEAKQHASKKKKKQWINDEIKGKIKKIY